MRAGLRPVLTAKSILFYYYVEHIHILYIMSKFSVQHLSVSLELICTREILSFDLIADLFNKELLNRFDFIFHLKRSKVIFSENNLSKCFALLEI